MVSSSVLQALKAERKPVGKGFKRNNTLLEDKTNCSRQREVLKKRKLLVREECMGDTMPTVDQVGKTRNFEYKHKTQPSKLNAIFPIDVVRCRRDGHLFSSGYVSAVTKSMNLNESNSADFFPSANYLETQNDIKPRMRKILFAWITEVHLKFELREVVLWATFQICDRFLSKVNINRRKLQLVGCTALWIASKYHEIYPPMVADLVHVSVNAFSIDDVVEMERRICSALGFQFSIPNAFQFLDRYTNVAMESIKETRLKNRVKWLARYGMERFHIQVKALQYTPSLLAAGALFTALKLTSNRWSKSCASCSGYTEDDLKSKSIFELIKKAIMDFESQSQQAIICKYSIPERGSVSTLRRKENCAAGTRRN